MAPQSNEGNAFTFDDDEDMDALLEAAANAGSAAVDELDEELTKAIEPEPEPGALVEEPVYEAPPAFEPAVDIADEDLDALLGLDSTPEPTFEPDPVFEQPTFEEPVYEEPKKSEAQVREELEALRAESEALLASEPVVEPVAVVAPPVVSPVAEKPVEVIRTPAEPVAPAVAPSVPAPHKVTVVRQTEAEQIAHAKAIIAAADEYRKLNPQTRNIVAQLISQDQELAEDEATVAIRAINADDLTFETMAALKEAKDLDLMERAFYILGLSVDVRDNLGGLVTAFSGVAFDDRSVDLVFAKALVTGIEQLDSDAISCVSSTEAVLRAAKQR